MGKVIAILAASMIAAGNISAVNQFDISVNKPGADIAPTMYGVFFEDINFGADGGLYAEMVKNRSFEFPNPLMGWYSSGKVTVKSDGPFSRNPHYVTLENSGHKEKGTGIDNEGYFGISFVKDSTDSVCMPEPLKVKRAELLWSLSILHRMGRHRCVPELK